jgi:hypothetical protein
MAEIDRRTMVRGMLFGAAFVTAGGVALTTPELAEAIPLAANKTSPLTADKTGPLAADKTGPIETDDLSEDQDNVELVQYWRRRRRRWWRHRRWRRRWWW